MKQLKMDAFLTKKMETMSTNDPESFESETPGPSGLSNTVDDAESAETPRDGPTIANRGATSIKAEPQSEPLSQNGSGTTQEMNPSTSDVIVLSDSDERPPTPPPPRPVSRRRAPLMVGDSIDTIEEYVAAPYLIIPTGKDKEYSMEAIKKHRFNEKTQEMEYLVKWKNYPPSENTWEPEENLVNCNSLQDAYYRNHHKKKQRRMSQYPTDRREGFARGLKVERVVGFVEQFGEIEVLLKWKTGFGKPTLCDYVSIDEIYSRQPSIIFDYMTEYIDSQNDNPEAKKNKKSDDSSESEEESSSDEETDEESDDSEPEEEKELPGEIISHTTLKSPTITGITHIEDRSYYIFKDQNHPGSQLIISLKTAHKYYRKAVFIYFEKNLRRGK